MGGCPNGKHGKRTGSEREDRTTLPTWGANGKEREGNGKLVFDEVVVEKLPLTPAAMA